MPTFRFNQSCPSRRDIVLHGEYIGSCPVTVEIEEPIPLGKHTGTASLYCTAERHQYVGVMEVPSLSYVEAATFAPISTDEMENFFGMDAAFALFKLAGIKDYAYMGDMPGASSTRGGVYVIS